MMKMMIQEVIHLMTYYKYIIKGLDKIDPSKVIHVVKK